MESKIEKLMERLKDVEDKLSSSDILQDQKKYRTLTQEHSYLKGLQAAWELNVKLLKQIDEAEELSKKETDLEFQKLLEEELTQLQQKLELNQIKLEGLLIPPDPQDHRNTILEIRAGTGGEEAALFVADCVRMYRLYADRMEWKYETLAVTESEMGGYKEYVMVLSGPNVYRILRYEGGTHRVQRVPETEAQGRVHTSAVTVAVLTEPEEESEISIDEKELRIDTYRSSGAGGQHVNVTDSAVRITHIPTGIVAYCQDERSQHKNKAKALRLLKAKIAQIERERKEQEIAKDRKTQVGTGDRSERIRTYNFPQNRITDHRINFTRYHLDRMMQGDLDEVTTALISFYRQKQMNEDPSHEKSD